MLQQRISTILMAAVTGLAGGALGPHLFSVVPAHAQEKVTQVVQGRSFELLDDAGRKRGEWQIDNSGRPVMQLYDERGRITWDTRATAKMVPLTQR